MELLDMAIALLVGIMMGTLRYRRGAGQETPKHKMKEVWMVQSGTDPHHQDKLTIYLRRRLNQYQDEKLVIGRVRPESESFDQELNDLMETAQERASALNVHQELAMPKNPRPYDW